MRKIKLMALLLAALMIVTAFAGCAGVKKEELDALDVRVQALEDLLNGQQKDLEEIKNDLAGLDNKEVLDAIDSMKTDLENQIKDVNTRVDDFEDKADAPIAGVSAETKAEQQKALALIEVKRAEFSKVSDEYSAEDYTKISEALGTATGAVNAATTVDAVKAAMTALDSELAKYMTYAMKAYDYYCKLLGNVNADAADLVEEAKAFLKEVKAIYDESNVDFEGKLNGVSTSKVGNEYVAELAYLVSEGSTEARDEYIDIYNAINDLCTLYTSKNTTKVIPYIEDGDIEFATLKTVKQYTDAAEDLVKSIKNDLGENLVYGETSYTNFGTLYASYETFVEEASLLGGDKLVNLVTNAADIVAAEDAYKLIKEAAENYGTATRISAGNYGDVFEYYTALGTSKNLLETTKGTKTIWVADEYEKVEDTLADWIAEYELSEDNVKAIIADKEKSTTFYNAYILDKHINGLLVEAFNNFKTEIAEKIVAINDVDGPSIDLVIAYDEVEELINDFFLLQEKTTDKTVEYPANVEVSLKNLTADDKANIAVILRDADIFNKFTEERVTKALSEIVFDKADGNGFITLYTFEADVDEIESNGTTKYFDATAAGVVTADNRSTGAIYKFLNTEYAVIKTASKAINDKIEALVKKVDNKTIANNEEFVTLEGLYIKIPTGETHKSGEKTFTSANNVYVLASDIYDTTATFETFMAQYVGTTPAPMTIEAFKYHNPEFVAMLDIDEFEAAKKTVADRLDTLFVDADAIVDLADAIDYVRTANAVIYYDLNGNGKYDLNEEFEDGDTKKAKYSQTVTNLVSLNDKAAVDTAWSKYDAWVKLGGAINMAKFANYIDPVDEKTYDDVFVMEKLQNPTKVEDTIKLIRNLDLQIGTLETMAANFVATVENVKKVDAANAITVTLDNNTLAQTGDSQRLFAWTNFKASTAEYAKANDGTYTYVLPNSPWKTDSKTTDCTRTSGQGNEDLKSWAAAGTIYRKYQLLKVVVEQNKNFKAANIEYLADAKNDYTDTLTDYYQLPDYVEYAAFEKAVADYAKYDLLSVKGYIFSKYTSDTDAAVRGLRKQINSATTIEDVESILYAYVVETGDEIAMEKNVDVYAIYDFERLADLNK